MKHLPNVLNQAIREGNMRNVPPGLYTVEVKGVHVDSLGCAQIEFNNDDQDIKFTQTLRPIDEAVAAEIDAAKLAILDHIERLADSIDHVVVSQEVWEENEELIEQARNVLPQGFAALPQEYLELHNDLAAAIMAQLVIMKTGPIAEYDHWVKVAERFNKGAGQIGQCLVGIPGIHNRSSTRMWGGGLVSEPAPMVAPVEFADEFRSRPPQDRDPIPPCVFWREASGTFVDLRGIAYSDEFRSGWYSRHREFPKFGN